MRKMHALSGFTFSTMECAVKFPFFRSANAVAGTPEFGSDSIVSWFFYNVFKFTILDLPADLGSELEIISVIIDAPGLGEIYIFSPAYAQ